MEKKFIQSIILKPPVVAGRQLLPLSLGHWFLLEFAESPYVTDAKFSKDERLYFEVLLPAILCSLPFDAAKTLLVDNYDKMPQIANEIAGTKIPLMEIWDTVSDYIRAYMEIPTFMSRAESGMPRISQMPTHWRIVCVLMSRFHMTESEAWNTATNKAFWFYGFAAEEAGSLELLPEQIESELRGVAQ